jgi:hypothetical protein
VGYADPFVVRHKIVSNHQPHLRPLVAKEIREIVLKQITLKPAIVAAYSRASVQGGSSVGDSA